MQPQSLARRREDQNFLGFALGWLGDLGVSAVKGLLR